MNPERSVSVIIPTYNRAALLGRAIDSVLAQTYPVAEIIVVDDGSTDSTHNQVWESKQRAFYAGLGSIRYIYQRNQGQAVARNTGIDASIGKWIAFLDSDDTWLSEKLERQFQALEYFKWRCGTCFTDAQFVNNPHMTTTFELARIACEQPLGIVFDTFESMVSNHQPYPAAWLQTQLVRADLARSTRFDSELRYSEDHDFVFRLAFMTDFCFVNSPLVQIDRTPPSDRPPKLWDQVDLRLRSDKYRFEKWLALSEELNGDVRAAILSHLRDTHSAWANWYLSQEEYPQARKAMNAAMKYGVWSYGSGIKWALTHFAPRLARKVATRYARRYNADY